MIRKTTCILLSAWGWVWLAVMLYYTSLFFITPHYSYHSEYWQGVAYAWLLGAITWIALPTASVLWRKNLSRPFLIIINIPAAIAFIYLSIYLISFLIPE
jgi:hypothetical protein